MDGHHTDQIDAIHLLGDRVHVVLGEPVPIAAELHPAATLAGLGVTEGATVGVVVEPEATESFSADE